MTVILIIIAVLALLVLAVILGGHHWAVRTAPRVLRSRRRRPPNTGT